MILFIDNIVNFLAILGFGSENKIVQGAEQNQTKLVRDKKKFKRVVLEER